jgi:adenine/guanine phosphoribosyltransferase-like PRPP-binding protein
MPKPKFNPTYIPELLKRQYRRTTMKQAAKILREKNFHRSFDAIAITGVSGALFGIPLAYMLGKELIIIRKAEKRHGGRIGPGGYLLGMRNARRYIIVDDLSESGHTLKFIRRSVRKQSPRARLVGVLLSRRMDEGILTFKEAIS